MFRLLEIGFGTKKHFFIICPRRGLGMQKNDKKRSINNIFIVVCLDSIGLSFYFISCSGEMPKQGNNQTFWTTWSRNCKTNKHTNNHRKQTIEQTEMSGIRFVRESAYEEATMLSMGVAVKPQ